MKKRILLLFLLIGCAPVGDLKKGGNSEYLIGLAIGNWRNVVSRTGTGTGTISLNTSVTGEYLIVRELNQTSN